MPIQLKQQYQFYVAIYSPRYRWS